LNTDEQDCELHDGRRGFAARFVTTLEDTNALANVYFARHISWQGRCRELFLATRARDVAQELAKDLRLITTHVECDYFSELHAFEDVEVRMALRYLAAHRMGLDFEYCVFRNATVVVAARGFQEIACMKCADFSLVPTVIPKSLADALSVYK
jgi:enediyne biosynthesis thioesterase